MAINKNHEFEELNGVKCGIVERNVSQDRTAFLKKLLEYNRYTVMVVPSPPPKAVPPPVIKPVEGAEMATVITPPVPVPVIETFTVGVTDVTFNPINAIFGRQLFTPGGYVVTQAYWYQNEPISHDEKPYYEHDNLIIPK